MIAESAIRGARHFRRIAYKRTQSKRPYHVSGAGLFVTLHSIICALERLFTLPQILEEIEQKLPELVFV